MLYYVNWVLTNAQLELIAADVSVVDYNYDRNKKKKGKKGEFNDSKASKSDVDKARKDWLSRYQNAEQMEKPKMSDVFGSFDVGKGIKA